MISPQYRFSFAKHPPIVRLAPGEEFEMAIADSDGLGPDLKPMPSTLFESTRRAGFPGNPLFGPIEIIGAEPGDALEVRLLSVLPDRQVARTLLAPNHGYLPRDLVTGEGSTERTAGVPRNMYLWRLGSDWASLMNPIGSTPFEVRIRPFLGCIGTAQDQPRPLSSLAAGNNGGNMDIPALRAGAVTVLPVFVSGALLYLGDIHAAQGAGEIVGGALETSGRVRIVCRLAKRAAPRWPRFRNRTGRGTIATQPTLARAVQLAFAEMIGWLTEDGLDRFDAYMLLSQACEFQHGGLGKSMSTVACFCSSSRLAQRPASAGSEPAINERKP